MITESLHDIRRLAGLTESGAAEFGALSQEMDKVDSIEGLVAELFPGMPVKRMTQKLKQKFGDKLKDKLLNLKAKRQQQKVQQAKPKPNPKTLDKYSGVNTNQSASKSSAHKHAVSNIKKYTNELPG